MHPIQRRGAAAEAAIALAAIEAGFGVFKPVSEGERYDLILDLRPGLVRVQCKAASLVGDVIVVRCRSGRRTRHGILMRKYTRDEVDGFGVYCAELRRAFFVPIEQLDGQATVVLRVAPPQNSQRGGIRWAADFAFEAKLRSSGAVAQLGRASGWQPEGQGFESPRLHSSGTTVGAHEFRNRFGWYMEQAAAGEEIAVTRRGRPYVRMTAG